VKAIYNSFHVSFVNTMEQPKSMSFQSTIFWYGVSFFSCAKQQPLNQVKAEDAVSQKKNYISNFNDGG